MPKIKCPRNHERIGLFGISSEHGYLEIYCKTCGNFYFRVNGKWFVQKGDWNQEVLVEEPEPKEKVLFI